MRMFKVKGENDPKSTFEKIHKVCALLVLPPPMSTFSSSNDSEQVQLLTGEYVPILVVLILYIYTQAQLGRVAIDGVTQAVIVLATAGRYAFAARVVVPGLGFLGATSTYIGFAGLLIAAAYYSV